MREVVKAAHDHSDTFAARSMFRFSSPHGLGSNRVYLVKLQQPVDVLEPIDPALGGQLVGRTVEALRDGRLDATIKVCQAACNRVFCGAGISYWLGTLIAGAWLLKGNDVPTEKEVWEWLSHRDIERLATVMLAGTEVLGILFRARVYVENKRPMIGELVEIALETIRHPSISPEAAQRALRAKGILAVRGEGPVVLVANTSAWVREKLAGADLERWQEALRELPGARPTSNAVRFGARTSRAVHVPLDGLGLLRVA